MVLIEYNLTHIFSNEFTNVMSCERHQAEYVKGNEWVNQKNYIMEYSELEIDI